MQRCAGNNVLVAHQTSQEPPALIAMIQSQVNLQHQLLAAQTTIARQDDLLARVGATLMKGAGMPLVSLTLPPTVAQTPMILGGAQPEGYVYICTNQGLTVWGHADIVQASLTDPACKPCADKKDCTEGCKRDFVCYQYSSEENQTHAECHHTLPGERRVH